MKRATLSSFPLLRLVPLLPLVAAGLVAAACADSDEEPSLTPDVDASVLPPVDAALDAPADVDAGPDADATPPATCSADKFCIVTMPDVRAWGLQNYRFTGIAMDPASGAWATTSSYVLGDGSTTSHLFHYEGNAWVPKFGVSPTQSTPFPYELKAIASNGSGTLLAVGGGSPWGPNPGPTLLRIVNGVHTLEFPVLSVPRALVAVTFTDATTAWSLDDQGRLYRAKVDQPGPLAWVQQAAPHFPSSENFDTGPKTLFRGANGVFLAGSVGGSFTPEGFIPGFSYVDKREALADGGASWSTSRITQEHFSMQAGVELGPFEIWLLAGNSVYRSHALDGGAPDAGDGGAEGGAVSPIDFSDPPRDLPFAHNALWARSATDLWVVGPVGRIYHWDGTTFSDAKPVLNGTPLTTRYLSAIAGLPNGEMWIGGDDIVIHREATP